MKPIKFKGHNVVYAENQKEYLPLPVYKEKNGTVTSCWKMTLFERLKVLFTGKIYFMTLTFNQPLQPQLPKVTFTTTEEQSK